MRRTIHGYALHVRHEALDLTVFEALLTAGRDPHDRGDYATAATVLHEALGLWRAPPLIAFANEPFAHDALARVHELRLEALETRIDADLALGRHRMLGAELKLLVAEHPLRERLRGQDARLVSQRAPARGAGALPRHASIAGRWARNGAEPVTARAARRDARQDPALEPPGGAAASPSATPRRAVAVAAGGGMLSRRAPSWWSRWWPRSRFSRVLARVRSR